MQIIPSSMLPERDEGALRQFLEGCRDAAQAAELGPRVVKERRGQAVA